MKSKTLEEWLKIVDAKRGDRFEFRKQTWKLVRFTNGYETFLDLVREDTGKEISHRQFSSMSSAGWKKL